MKILITNDDGLQSEGIQVLAAALRARHEAWMVAPSSNRSGVSHGITMTDPLRLIVEGERDYSCSGLPVDCFMSGAQGIMPSAPDVVISGINRGANLGTDLVYSGTAAAARQAAIAGIPGIAVSLLATGDDEFLWEPLARFIVDNLEELMALCERDVFVNVNAPSLPSYGGARMTGISRRDYRDSIVIHEGPDGCKYSYFQGGNIVTEGDGTTDWDAVEAGCVSVSRVFAQPVTAPGTAGRLPNFRV